VTQCHIVPLLGEGNHKGLPLHDMTVCRGNPTCKALNLMALRAVTVPSLAPKGRINLGQRPRAVEFVVVALATESINLLSNKTPRKSITMKHHRGA